MEKTQQKRKTFYRQNSRKCRGSGRKETLHPGKQKKTFREQEQKVTEVLEECGSTAKDRRQEAAAEAAATEVLEESAATEVLEEETGAVTQELSEEDGGGRTACPAGKFEIIEEIICVHSEERIG